MPVRLKDPQFEVENRVAEIQELGDKEMVEREAAARAYSVENEAHFVGWLEDCASSSIKAREPIRKKQLESWNVYQEKEPASYANKAAWQSRVVVPKPFETVGYGLAAIKKAFSPDFLSIKDPINPDSAKFWQKVMEIQLNSLHSKFVDQYTAAVEMSLAVGESMEMIPRWTPSVGLSFELVEPWKILRDPEAPARDSQGGLFWIHTEWLDLHVLLAGEKLGKYYNVRRAADLSGQNQYSDDFFTSKEALEKRKGQIWQRGHFRKMVQTSEFWGTVLAPNGEVLLERGWYTVAAGRIIGPPKAVQYNQLRWPGISFSPMPHLLRHGGRGFIEGIIAVWESMNTLMCLHEDAYKWIVNPPTEINVDGLSDPADVSMYPGKNFLTQDTVHGQQAVRTINRRDPTGSVLANMQYLDQLYQRGSWVTDAVQGLPGYRKDMTYRESRQNLSQSMGIFSLMGSNLEMGAIAAITAAQDVIRTFASFFDYRDILDDEFLSSYNLSVDDSSGAVLNLPPESGAWHVSGIGELMADAEVLQNVMATIVPLSQNPGFAPFINNYKILQSIERRSNLEDEKIIVDEKTAVQIEQAQQADMEKRAQYEKSQQEAAAKAEKDSAQASQMDLMEKVLDITGRIDALENQRQNGR